MNILCIGYYDKFSRFFLEIKKELKKKDKNLKFTILSIYFSGFLYSFLRFSSSSLISFSSWLKVLINKKKYLKIIKYNRTYRNIEFDNIINFHIKLNQKINKKDLLLQTISYIDILNKKFTSFNPDVLLLIGDSRLLIEIAKKMASEFNVKVYFIEQGPFGTTFFDLKGVNANNSIRDFVIDLKVNLKENEIKKIDEFINKPKQNEYNRSPIYRILDLIIVKLIEKSVFYPPDLKYTDTFPSFFLKKKYNISTDLLNNTSRYYLLILQVPLDVNIIYHSPYFINHYDMVKSIHKNLPENSKLIIREHPVYKNKYEKELYDYCKKHEIFFDTNTSLKKSIKNSNVVIVNNSTVGLEAISMKKPVVVLGNSYYDNPKICIKYMKQHKLNQILKDALNFTPDTKSLNIFLNEFLFNYLIEGSISDNKSISSKTIAKKILNLN